MGLDLRLLPVDHDGGNWGFSHTILNCANAGAIHDIVRSLPETDPPDDFTTYLAHMPNGDHGYGKTTETPYGEPLRCLRVHQLLTLRDDPIITASEQNRATWAYLAELPSTMKVALFWH